MAEVAKGINPEITAEVTEEIVAEAKEEVKRPLLGCAQNCANWWPYGRVPASGRVPPDRMSWVPALLGCTARSGRR